MSKGSLWKSVLPAAVLIAVFAAAFFLGRNTVPYEICISAEHFTPPTEAEQMQQEQVIRTMPDDAAAGKENPAQEGRLDLNLATKDELMTLPGIGEKLAERILQYRQSAGRYSAPEQIMDVEGIGEGIFERIRDSITVGDFQ